MGTGELNGGLPCHPGGVETLPVASCYGNREKRHGLMGRFARIQTLLYLTESTYIIDLLSNLF